MKVIEKTLDIIEAILETGDEVGLANLAEITGFNRTTVHRIVSLLVERGYLYQKSKGDKYSLGLKFLQYSNPNRTITNLKEKALPYMQNLCDEISETINMAILDGYESVGIAVVAAERLLRVVPGEVNKYPLHCTAIGKIHLAYMSDEKIESFINILSLPAYTDNTLTDPIQLIKEIKVIRRDGIAFDDEEYSIGIRSAAAPLRDNSGVTLAAISFVGPTVRISKPKLIQLSSALKNCALKISLSLGYNEE